ncbi:MAG: tetratricopeptide repeat protein [Solirubrobacterales bacterium]
MSQLILDIEQLSMLLELEAPFGVEDVKQARKKMAKRWHPDIAPPGKRQAHEDHIKVLNQAADELEGLLHSMPGGSISASALKVSAEAARKRRAEEGRRAYEQQQAEARMRADQEKHDPFHSQLPDHSVVYRYARCNAYPEWGVGSILGIYFTGEGDNIQQWARVAFEPGVRTVPAGTLDFVEFGKPDEAKDRARRFLLSAEHAMAEGDYELAAQRLIYARDADEHDPTIHRLMTVAFWQAGEMGAAARSVRAWVRVEPGRPAPHRYAARLYEAMGLYELAAESAERECATNPRDGTAWARLGGLRLRLLQPEAARESLTRARRLPELTVDVLLDLALADHLLGERTAALEAVNAARKLDDTDPDVWTAFAHALDRTGAIAECIMACEHAIAIGADALELGELRARKVREQPPEIENVA